MPVILLRSHYTMAATKTKGLQYDDLPKHIQGQIDLQEGKLQASFRDMAQADLHADHRRGLNLLYMWLVISMLISVWFLRHLYYTTKWIVVRMWRLTKHLCKVVFAILMIATTAMIVRSRRQPAPVAAPVRRTRTARR